VVIYSVVKSDVSVNLITDVTCFANSSSFVIFYFLILVIISLETNVPELIRCCKKLLTFYSSSIGLFTAGFITVFIKFALSFASSDSYIVESG